MAIDLASSLDLSIRSKPPVDGAELVGWVAVAEWRTPDGGRRLERYGEPARNGTQLKGYLHSALYRTVTTGFDDRRSD
jgi:hypothetical protein